MANERHDADADADTGVAILRRVQEYSPYQLTKISAGAVEVFELAAATLTPSHRRIVAPLLKMLECYLCVTNKTLECRPSGGLRLGGLYGELIGAIYSAKFVEWSPMNRYTYTRAWNQLICAVDGVAMAEVRKVHAPSSNSITPAISHLVAAFEKKSLNADEVFYWRSSQIVRRGGELLWISLRPVGLRYGRVFAEYLHSACQTHVFSSNGRVIEVNQYFDFLVSLPPTYSANSFAHNHIMEVLWREFKLHFVGANLGPSMYRVLCHSWKIFLFFAHAHLEGKGPFGRAPWNLTPLPSGDVAAEKGPNVRVKKGGEVVVQKLLVDVPLKVTDDEALQIIFGDLDARLKIISTWARNSVALMWGCYERRVEAAQFGDADRARIYGAVGFTDDHYARMAAKLTTHGFTPTSSKASPLARPIGDAARELGLPFSGALLPFMALLVIEHPELTPSFFDSCELYDKHGHLNGFTKTDTGHRLQGYKKRKGAELAHQVIHLTPETAVLVEQVQVLTEPLRKYLKERGDDNWRKLFLGSGAGFGYPKGVKSTGHTADVHQVKSLELQFVEMGLVTQTEVSGFVSRFSLISLRATAAVVFYIENPDLKAFAKKLGHTKYSPKLLASYMPAPLLSFFQQRWLRLHHTAIIATAMGDSKHAARATGFKNMAEVHAFLSNHALKLRPRVLASAALKGDNVQVTDVDLGEINPFEKVAFSVSVENLALLLSLSAAVKKAPDAVSATAWYWATYGERLVSYIDSSDDNFADFQDLLFQARKQVSSVSVEALVHA